MSMAENNGRGFEGGGPKGIRKEGPRSQSLTYTQILEARLSDHSVMIQFPFFQGIVEGGEAERKMRAI